MKLWIVWLVMGLAANATSIVYAAGGDGGAGGTSKRDPSYDAGLVAIEKQDWQGAIRMFKATLAWNRFDADAHNWLGFAYRNAGDMKRAFEEYEEALRLDPQHRGAHEYLGEAYVMANNIPKAEEHLAALEKLCGRSCPEYHELEEAIDKSKKGG